MAIQNVSDSYVLAQTAGDTYNGNASDQTYSINPNLVGAGDVITIVDQGGNNVIELPAGLQIVSSKTISNQTILTLSNGAVIDIRGADTFTFNIGQNLAGGDTVGSSLNFADFAQNVLGVAVPAPGAPVVDGGGSVTNDDGSATVEGQGPVLALTASANTVDEGASVSVSVTGAAANSTVAYTISGTGVDAADVNALTGTITTDANGAGTASIAVTADNATEGEETMTVTLDGTTVSTDIKINDTSVAPQTVDLTTGIDDIQPADGSQTINGVVSALSSEATLNAGDKIDGGAGEDTLNADMKLSFTGFTGDGFLKNVENVNLTNSSTILREFDASGVTGATTYNVTGNVNLKDLDSVSAVNLSGRASQDFTVAYASKVTDGSADTLALGLNNVGIKADSKATPAVSESSVTITAAGIETLNLTSTGMNVIDLAAGGAKAVTATGAGYLEINDLGANAKTFDGSTATGALDVTLGAATGMTSVQTGTGDDKLAVVLGDDVTGTAVIADAGGNDTMTFTGSGGVQLTQSGIETVSLNVSGDTTLSFLNTTGVTKLVAEDSLGGNVIVANSSGDLALDLQGATAAGTARTVTLDTSGAVSVNAVSTSSTASATARDIANDSVVLTKAGSLAIDVAADTDFEGTVTATEATSVTAAIKGETSGTANVVAGKATSVIITEVGQTSSLDLDVAKATTVDITNAKGLTLANGDLSAVQIFNATGAGGIAVNNTVTANSLSALNQATISNTGVVTLGNIGSATQEYSANVALSGTGATTIGTMNTKDQAINVTGTSTGAVVIGAINAITGNVTVDVDTTSTLKLGAVTGKDVSLNSNGVLGASTYGGNVTASGNVTWVGSNLVANDIDGTGAGKFVLAGAANSTQTVALTGGIFADTIAIDTAAVNQIVTVSGDLGATGDMLTVTGQSGDQTISIAGLSSYDMATITGGAGADKLTGGAGNDTFVVAGTTEQVSGDVIAGGTGTNSISLNNAAGAVTGVFDFDNISDVLSLTVADADGGANGTAEAITITFDAIAETTSQTVVLDASVITDADDDLVVTNNAASSTTVFNITGGAGDDVLVGSNGADTLTGGAGADTLTGGAGADTLTGGADVDTFNFSDNNGADVITDFTTTSDKLSFDGITGITATSGTAVAANAAIIADATDGAVYVFADGADGTGTAAITDYTNVTQVAAFLEAGLGAANAENYVAVINDLVADKSYAYLIDVDAVTTAADTIEAGDVTLIGTITEVAGAALVAGDIA